MTGPIHRQRLETALDRLATLGDGAIFTRLYTESARAAADGADRRRREGYGLGPLDGAIVTIKDLFDVAGEPTTAGSRILNDAAPANEDAVVVQRLRGAGAVILGKTGMSEFAFTGLGLNPHWGTPRNAVDAERVPGGSSSGAGVSVARGIADIAIGTDTGGSVRIPAAFNRVVGFKPSAFRIPREGVFPLSYELDSVGPLAPSIQAAADADAVMAGEAPAALRDVRLAGLRFGVLREYADNAEPTVLVAFERALRLLVGEGAVLLDADIADMTAPMRDILADAPIVAVEAAEIHAEALELRPQDFDPNVLKRIRRGREISGPAYLASLRRRRSLAATMDQRMRAWDYLVLPTVACLPPRLSEVVDPAAFQRLNALVLRNTGLANFFDLCAVSLPMPGTSIPAGLSLLGRKGHDAPLLAVAAGIEKMKPHSR